MLRLVLAALLGLAACTAPPPPAPTGPRDPRWATPLVEPGCSNLFRITPTLYRGAQPSAECFRSLHKLGVKTVVNLRAMHSDRDEIGHAGLAGSFDIVEIPLLAWDVDPPDMLRFLRVAIDPARQPVFFHCQHGADRTGTMAAAYRIVVEGWSKDETLREMRGGGYGFHEIWKNLPKHIAALDAAAMRASLGLPPLP